jgi:endonuclease/exonuclease/phosphatase family metal-dependent hydrolase
MAHASRLLAALILASLPFAGAGLAAEPGRTLRLATWNLEWLLTPQAFAELAPRCTRASDERRSLRSIPCDVAAGHERSATDLAGLARYARALDADVIALQEVDGIAAARQVFPGHDFCFTGGPAVQKTGFALRAGLPHRCEPDLQSLSLGDTLRRGAVVVLYPDTSRELHLLGVHLKSGCPRGRLDATQKACVRLAHQLPALAAWVRGEQLAGHRFALLGDFNRDLLAEARQAGGAPGDAGRVGAAGSVWGQLVSSAGAAQLRNSAEGERHVNCWRGQLHAGYIDYILLDGTLAARELAGGFRRLTYDASDAWRLKLSDHCPVALTLRLD